METFQTKHRTERNPSAIVDCGAQWLHGRENKLHSIAEKYNLLRSELSEEGLGYYIRDDGYIFDDFFRKKIDFKIGQILEDCMKFTNSTNYPNSVDDYLNEKFNVYLKTLENFAEREKAKQLFDWHRRFEIIDNSCLNLKQLSAKFWGLYAFNGESCQAHINIKNGFNSLINVIVQEIGLKHIELDKTVTNINWNIFGNDNNTIIITTNDEEKYYAKNCIVTFSLGVLKELEQKLFTPQLPEFHSNIIQDMGYETINKIFLQFDKSWWNEMNGLQLIFSDNNYNNKKWTRYLSGFDILQPDTNCPNTLVGWVGGHGAIEMEKLTDHEIVEDCINILKIFTKFSIPNPIKYYCSRWRTNKYIRGSYSFITTKCDKNNTIGHKLSLPITSENLPYDAKIIPDDLKRLSIYENEKNSERKFNSILYFAGEACHPKYFSTAHGAFLSGIEQAQKIVNTFY